jgi:exonuclease III
MHKSCLDIQITGTVLSQSENLITVNAILKGSQVRLIAIYGPNNVDLNFFTELENSIQDDPDIPTIIAGDWNCTVSTDKIDSNPDCVNMRTPPNLNHSKKLLEICNRYLLTDPFRFLYPEKKEFSYCPRNPLQKNSSRLDYFIISESIIDNITDCVIADTVQNKLFDHKAVKLSFNIKKNTGNRKKNSNKQ